MFIYLRLIPSGGYQEKWQNMQTYNARRTSLNQFKTERVDDSAHK